MSLAPYALIHRHPNIRFIIGGDGPKRRLLESVAEGAGLLCDGRVSLVGAVPHEDARAFLLQGDIFLNTSLTEAFCIAIVEAASCGLMVVSTAVGGVPEVLPPGMAVLAEEPSQAGIVAAVEQALARLPSLDRWAQHAAVADMYSWPRVAERTVKVYDHTTAQPAAAAGASRRGSSDGGSCSHNAAITPSVSSYDDDTLLARLERFHACGTVAGKIWCLIALIELLLLAVLRWWRPDDSIQVAVDWPTTTGTADTSFTAPGLISGTAQAADSSEDRHSISLAAERRQ